MTNAQIIFNARMKLLEENKIKGTGRMIKVLNEVGEELTIEEPEEIHTFQAWKALGYSVKKGEKAVAKFTIWKYTEKQIETEDSDEDETVSNMFMKNSAFFSAAQVEKTKEKRAV